MAIRTAMQVVKVTPGQYRGKDGAMHPNWSVNIVDDDGEVYRIRMYDQATVPTKGKYLVTLEASADFQYVKPVAFEAVKQ
jgi:hypothetical protein